MKTTSLLAPLALLFARAALANDPIPGSSFTDNNGQAAALAAAPMWYMASGTCMPSAAEDGAGHQTNGVDADHCNINALSHGCPVQPKWQGANTGYNNIAGEPFANIPTYWAAGKCGDGTWRIIYYVYFKKDTGHKSDWEGVVVKFRNSGGDNWVRDSVLMEQDGKHPSVAYGDINDTFDGLNDWTQFQQKNKNHPKFYFGKWHHSAHADWHTTSFKNTCPPTSGDDFRNADYQFWAANNLRHVSVLDPSWNWGSATSPANIDVCTY